MPTIEQANPSLALPPMPGGRRVMNGPCRKVRVELGERSYEIVIGEGVVDSATEHVTPLLRRARLAVITEEKLAALHLERLVAPFRQGCIDCDVLVLPPGESSKSWEMLQRCCDWLVEHDIERQDLVLALGGGVIGDLAGFAAAITRRGIRHVQVPTTLLAQVDSSVGGKTGINAGGGKNLVGAFHQPSMVLADIGLLETLDERQLRSGYAEVVKYGLLGDAGFFSWLEENGSALLRGDSAIRMEAVRRCCAMKATIVASDEKEAEGRALLNLGHTFGHALEAAVGFSDRLLHGEAVAAGCCMAFDLSAHLGLCAHEVSGRVAAHFKDAGLPGGIGGMAELLPGPDGLIALMAKDKKTVGGRLHLVLAHGIGRAFLTAEINPKIVREFLADKLAMA